MRLIRLSSVLSWFALTTLRKGLTKREAAGYSTGLLVLHPLDWENVELALASSKAIEHLSLP